MPRMKTYIAVVTGGATKYVTRIENSVNIAYWDDGKPAVAVPESIAKDTVFGLCLGGYTAYLVKAYDSVKFSNQAPA